MESKNIKYIPQVDHLRAFAALLIVVYHGTQLIWHELAFNEPFAEKYWVEHWIVTDNPLKVLIIEGHTAVSLFMVLSGFIFTIGAYKNRVIYSKFIINRLLRTYPLFILLLFTGIYAFPSKFEFLSFLQTVLALSNANHGIAIGSFSSMFWAIAVEWQFYLIFPFLIVILNKKGVRFLFGVLLVFLLMRAIACLEGANIRDLSYFTIVGRMDQFLIGMALAVIYKNNHFGPWPKKNGSFLVPWSACFYSLFLPLESGFKHPGGDGLGTKLGGKIIFGPTGPKGVGNPRLNFRFPLTLGWHTKKVPPQRLNIPTVLFIPGNWEKNLRLIPQGKTLLYHF